MPGFEPEWPTDAIESAIANMDKQMERELLGAWRAGYNYLHVYEPTDEGLIHTPLRERFTLTQYTFPTKEEHRPSPDSLRYLYTYDIGAVPDEKIIEALETHPKP